MSRFTLPKAADDKSEPSRTREGRETSIWLGFGAFPKQTLGRSRIPPWDAS